MADGVGLGPLNTANVQRASSDKSLGIKQAEKAFEAASQKAQDISIDRGVEVLLSERPASLGRSHLRKFRRCLSAKRIVKRAESLLYLGDREVRS